MLNHSGTLWWGAGNRMAATPHSLWSLLFGFRLTHKITYFWAAKDPTAHQPPHFFRQQLQTSTCTNWSNWSTPADPSCQTSTFTTTIMAASTAASILKGKHGCFYHSPHYQVLVKSLELLTKATTSAFLPRSNFLLPVTAQELISPWAWDKGTATSVRPQVPMRGQEGAPLLQTWGEGSGRAAGWGLLIRFFSDGWCVTQRQEVIFRDGLSRLQMDAQQPTASSARSNSGSPAADRAACSAASANTTQAEAAAQCPTLTSIWGPSLAQVIVNNARMPWMGAGFHLPPLSSTIPEASPKSLCQQAEHHPAPTVWCPLSQPQPTSRSWPGILPKAFRLSFVAQCHLNNQSHPICFLHGFKEIIFHIVRSEVRETS